ncbi:MAG: EamA family transporter [Verrucomicrobia bacterium]|nr:MAG: EamA family transporter [Verrucomicrobiota bacterium]
MALIAFAANSVLCRMALGNGAIDAASFTSVRLLSGAVTLLVILLLSGGRSSAWSTGGWLSPFLLAAYAIAFSFAYLTLSTGTGALILFGSVQMTMILWALRSGERPSRFEWAGLLLAFAGMAYLVSPGFEAPSFGGAFLMAVAGVSWGFYTVRGRGRSNPLAATTGNFILAVPFALATSALTFRSVELSTSGLVLGILSGSLASGCGYVVWYAALRHLTSTRAAVVQLSVPMIAAMGGVLFVSEAVSFRLVLSSVLILGGVGLAIGGRRPKGTNPEELLPKSTEI